MEGGGTVWGNDRLTSQHRAFPFERRDEASGGEASDLSDLSVLFSHEMGHRRSPGPSCQAAAFAMFPSRHFNLIITFRLTFYDLSPSLKPKHKSTRRVSLLLWVLISLRGLSAIESHVKLAAFVWIICPLCWRFEPHT